MKKIAYLLVLVFVLALPLGYAHAEDKKISVVSTVFAPYDFTRQIAQGAVDLTMLLPPACECHSYEPTPQDIIRIQNCDVFIYVGGESDAWVQSVLNAMDCNNKTIITLMDCVETVEEELVEGMQHEHDENEDHDHDHEEAELDEHVWTSPRNAQLIVQRISDALCKVDPVHAALYQQNTADYIAKLQELDASIQDVVDHAVRTTLVFGDRFPFRYLADAYGLSYYAAFPGCSTDTEPSAQTVAFLIKQVRADKIPVVFHIELSNEKMANTICEETGAKKLLLHACHNISKADFESGKTYLDFMAQNVEALREALQ